jgi:putative phosphoribosyl transferase
MMFKDRRDAGRKLAKQLLKYKGANPLTLGIPRGGVLVALPICKALRAEFDVLIARKLPIPWNPEAGFGAMAQDGTICLNPEIHPLLGLSKEWEEDITRRVREEIERRNEVYRGARPYPNVTRRLVIVVDDGLATGYTVLAAVESLKKHKPKELVVATPVAQERAAEIIRERVDEFVCLHVSKELVFAVASFYLSFPDLSDEEVLRAIAKARSYARLTSQ